jgi:hypothetical protein
VHYLISTFAPAASNFLAISSASSLEAPSLTGFGALSTSSFASFRPRPSNGANFLDHCNFITAELN